MSILATDLVLYCSTNMPTTDSGNAGGAINPKMRADFTQLAANDDVEVISSSASDTQNCTIVARSATGAITTQTAALTGTSAKIFSTLGASGVVERILSVTLASDAIGTVTVRRSVAGATIRAIPIGERGFIAMFQQDSSDPVSSKDYYAKLFWKNAHATLTLLTAVVKENADPDTRITFCLANAIDDTATSTNRLTSPAGGALDVGTFDSNDKNVPGSDIAAASAIGVWFKLTLPGGDAAHRSTYTSELDGNTV